MKTDELQKKTVNEGYINQIKNRGKGYFDTNPS